jgi:type IV secretory pathway VirB2 component (pilin)
MSSQQPSPEDGSAIALLAKALQTTVERITNPIALFLIVIGILILIGAALGGRSLVIELRIFFGFLALLGVAAIAVSYFLKSTNRNGGWGMEENSTRRYHRLREWLRELNNVQFEDLRNATLSPSRQDDLEMPLTKGSYLNDMRRWKELDKVEEYLITRYPDRFDQEK